MTVRLPILLIHGEAVETIELSQGETVETTEVTVLIKKSPSDNSLYIAPASSSMSTVLMAVVTEGKFVGILVGSELGALVVLSSISANQAQGGMTSAKFP